MPVLRFILAGLIALAALCATLFAAVVVVFSGLVGYVAQLLQPRRRTGVPAPLSPRTQRRRTDDVIDVVATSVPTEPPKL